MTAILDQMIDMDEKTLRDIVTKAVELARRTSPDNMCDEAVIQKALKERFVDGRWRSAYFLEKIV